ncbi:sensor histidine kinase [Pararhizobium gei]|uniref:sensor histidine kinase n=1 Tax=Pararhizobium gei TaxID=1395951 RepID=UPI0023DCDE88|nr:sensor histidine kinase [Rhizobium gei]
MGYLCQTSDLTVVRSGNLPDSLRPLTWAGDEEVFGSSESGRLRALKMEVLSRNTPAFTEINFATAAGILTYRIDIDRIDVRGETGILSVFTDISETCRRERVLKTLLRELSHRSKNLLAIVQGIATQTARQALSLDYFLSKFRGRIQSLAYSQDLVTDSSWRGAFLFTLAERQFSAYWPSIDTRIAVHGVNAHLSPNASLHIGLALHELIVDAASRGAVAAGANAVTIDCTQTTLDDKAAIELVWKERLPAAFSWREDREETSFARTVLERVVPVAIGGKATYRITADLVEYRLAIPAQEYEILTETEE